MPAGSPSMQPRHTAGKKTNAIWNDESYRQAACKRQTPDPLADARQRRCGQVDGPALHPRQGREMGYPRTVLTLAGPPRHSPDPIAVSARPPTLHRPLVVHCAAYVLEEVGQIIRTHIEEHRVGSLHLSPGVAVALWSLYRG